MSRFFLRSSKTCRRARKCNRKMEAKQVKDDINFMKNKKNRDTLLIWATYSMSWGVGSSSPSSSSPSCCSWREETRRSVSSFPTEGTWERVFEFRRWRSLVNATTPLKSLLLFSLFHDGESQSLGTSVASLFVWSLWMFVWGSEKLPFCTYVFLLIMCWSRSCFLGSNAKCWRLVYLLWTIKSCSCSSEKAFI